MSDDNAFHGYRYLLDAKNSRQYAIRFSNGAKPSIQVFSVDPRQSGFKSGENVYAFDDEISVTAIGGRAVLSTRLFQIGADSQGVAKRLLFSPQIDYYIDFSPDGESLLYRLTAASREVLEDEGFDVTEVPNNFSVDVSGLTHANTDGNIVIDLATLRSMPFPPHQTPEAHIARAQVAKSGFQPEVEQEWKPSTKSTDNKPVRDFNRVSNSRTNSVKPYVSYKVPDATIESLLRQFCKDLTEKAENGQLDPIIGRDAETDQALKVLTRRKQSSLCFTGDAGVGKTAMFSAVAQHLVDNEAEMPESLKGARVLELDLQAMNAGAKYRGQFEEKLKPLIDGLAEREGVLKGRKIILAIDEIHSQLTAGKAEGGSDSGNMMKPFLTSKGISVMGTTTDAEYKKYIEADGALGRRFEKMNVTSTATEATVEILKTLWPLTREHNGMSEDISDENFRYIVTMTDRYAPQESQPSKAEKVMNMAAAGAEFRHSDKVEREDILAAVAQMANLPVSFLNQSDNERFLKLSEELPKEVLGQPELARVVDGLIGSRSGLTDENQPWGCFVLQGPTGTGKTETCKALARYLFGSEDALIKLDMSEYSEKHSVARLIGAPPGYVGFDSAEPALTEKVRKRPYSILLLDEIEKAHPDVFNVLLPVLNDGKMTDNQGKVTLFNNVIIVMTTNAGAAAATTVLQGNKGFGFNSPNDANAAQKTENELKEIYKKAISTPAQPGMPALFRPEMINRIEELGGFILFKPLDMAVVSKLVVREIKKVNDRLASQAGANVKGLSIEVTDEVKAKLSELGYDPAMGARPLRKVVREKIANPFGKWLMAHRAEVEAFIAENGAAKIVVDNVDAFEPKIVSAVATTDAAVANDNATAAKTKKVITPRKKAGPGPK